MSFIYSQALVEAFSAANCSDTNASVPSSANPTLKPSWWHDKTMEPSRHSRFGMTYAPLTESHGAALLTWFVEGFPVRTYQPLEKAPDSTGRAVDCGQKWQGSFAKLDRNTSLWKTAQGSLIEDSMSSCVIWPRWGLMRNGVCLEQAIPALPMYVKGSGYWHTMTANDCKPAGKVEMAMVQAHERGESVPNTYIRLRSQVAARSNMYGPVNPPWAEWLMGWVIGWTDLKPLEMDKFQEWQQQHSLCFTANKEAA